MKNNHIIMKLGFAVMVVALLISIIFSYYIRLDDPVFLRNCIEFSAASSEETYNNVMQFQYIANNDDNRFVTGISFEEAPEMVFSASETLTPYGSFPYYQTTSNMQGNNLEKYRIHTVYVQQLNYYREDWKGEKELNTANVIFSDGSSITVDLGRIVIYSEDIQKTALSSYFTSSSNNGSSSTKFNVDEDLTLLSIDSNLINNIEEIANIKLDDVSMGDINEEEYKVGKILNITSELKVSESKDSDYDIYDVRPKLFYELKNGTKEYTRVYNLTWQRDLSQFRDILSYLRIRGAF